MAAGILRTPAGAATGRPAGTIAALRATALGSKGLAAAPPAVRPPLVRPMP